MIQEHKTLEFFLKTLFFINKYDIIDIEILIESSDFNEKIKIVR